MLAAKLGSKGLRLDQWWTEVRRAMGPGCVICHHWSDLVIPVLIYTGWKKGNLIPLLHRAMLY